MKKSCTLVGLTQAELGIGDGCHTVCLWGRSPGIPAQLPGNPKLCRRPFPQGQCDSDIEIDRISEVEADHVCQTRKHCAAGQKGIVFFLAAGAQFNHRLIVDRLGAGAEIRVLAEINPALPDAT